MDDVRHRVSVSAVSSWRWSLDEDLAFWELSGIEHVGLSLRKLEQGPGGVTASAARVREAGLRVSNIVELGWWKLHDRSTWPPQQERLLAAVDAAHITQAHCLVLTTGPAFGLTWDAAAAALREALEPIAAAARDAGVVVTLENTSPLRLDLSFITTLRDALELAWHTDARVCLEVNSCFAERDLAHTIGEAGPFIQHVQVNDFMIGSLSSPDRAVPGDGDIPLAAIAGLLETSGYRGAYEIEMVGPRIDEEGYASAITRAVRNMQQIVSEADSHTAHGAVPLTRVAST